MFGSTTIGIGIGIPFTNNQSITGVIPDVDTLLLEDGFNFLLEDGVSLILLQ